MTLKLVPELRKELKKPYGKLHKNVQEIIKNLEEQKTISVGDLTTYNLFKNNFYPKIAIIDGKIERENFPKSKEILNTSDYQKIQVKNPASHITDELMETVKSAISQENKVIINIQGEEDLAVIPAIKFAPKSHKIIYGQPDKGVVRVKVNQKNKQKINKIIKNMRRI